VVVVGHAIDFQEIGVMARFWGRVSNKKRSYAEKLSANGLAEFDP
jgi:hypothetical protein